MARDPITRLLGAAIFALASCALETDVLRAPAGDARAVILLIVREESPPEGIAFDRPDPSSTFFTAPAPSGPATLYTLQLGCSLAAIGLAPGKLALVEAPAVGRPLPKADAIFTSRWDGRVSWAAATDVPAGLRIAAPSPCVDFEATNVISASEASLERAHATFAIALDDATLFMAVDDGRFFRVSAAGAVPVTGLSTTTPHLAALRASDGDFWQIGALGAFAKGHPDRGFEVQPSLSVRAGARFMWLDVSPEGEPFEMFSMSDEATLEHFDGTRWTALRSEKMPTTNEYGGVVWIAPNRALSIGARPTDAELLRAPNEVVPNPLPVEPIDDRLTTLLKHRELGPIIGTDSGDLIAWNDGDEVNLGGSEVTARVRVTAELDGGVLFGGRNGELAQYHPGFGFCPAVSFSPFTLGLLAPAGDQFLIVTFNYYPDQEDFEAKLLSRTTPAPPPYSCP